MKIDLGFAVIELEIDQETCQIRRLMVEADDIKADTLRKIPIGRLWAAWSAASWSGLPEQLEEAVSNAGYKLINDSSPVSGSPLCAQAPEPERCEHCGGELVLLSPKDTVKICRDCGVAAIRRRAGRPVDLWLGPPRRDTVRRADLDLQQDG